jgi:hypothetical protein
MSWEEMHKRKCSTLYKYLPKDDTTPSQGPVKLSRANQTSVIQINAEALSRRAWTYRIDLVRTHHCNKSAHSIDCGVCTSCTPIHSSSAKKMIEAQGLVALNFLHMQQSDSSVYRLSQLKLEPQRKFLVHLFD